MKQKNKRIFLFLCLSLCLMCAVCGCAEHGEQLKERLNAQDEVVLSNAISDAISNATSEAKQKEDTDVSGIAYRLQLPEQQEEPVQEKESAQEQKQEQEYVKEQPEEQERQQTDGEDLNQSVDAILSADREFLYGYPVDDSFVCWFRAKYGSRALEQVAAAARNKGGAQVWYETTGCSLHVLWLDYCEQLGLHQDQLARVTRQACASPDETVISFAGDMNFDDRTGTMQYLKQHGVEAILSAELRTLIAQSDIMMVNNECTFSTRGEPLEGKDFTFRSDPANVSILKKLGVDIVGIANNHVYDYGPEALSDTIQTLNNAGIPNVGAGNNLEEAKQPWYFVANGRKIAFVAASQIERSANYTKEATETTPGVLKTLNPDKYLEVIRQAKEHSDYVIAFVHWGTEGSNHYEADQKELAEKYAAAGADAVIGGHTHCLQGITYVDDTPVIYSLGNFWFGSTPTDGVRKRDTAVAQVIIASDGSIQFRFIPCVQENRHTYLVTSPTEKARIIAFEQSLSAGVTIDADGYVAHGQ